MFGFNRFTTQQHIFLFGTIETSKDGDRSYIDTSPNSECSLHCRVLPKLTLFYLNICVKLYLTADNEHYVRA